MRSSCCKIEGSMVEPFGMWTKDEELKCTPLIGYLSFTSQSRPVEVSVPILKSLAGSRTPANVNEIQYCSASMLVRQHSHSLCTVSFQAPLIQASSLDNDVMCVRGPVSP